MWVCVGERAHFLGDVLCGCGWMSVVREVGFLHDKVMGKAGKVEVKGLSFE